MARSLRIGRFRVSVPNLARFRIPRKWQVVSAAAAAALFLIPSTLSILQSHLALSSDITAASIDGAKRQEPDACFDPTRTRYTEFADRDGDGVPDILENYQFGSNLEEHDSDGDGVPDCWEARYSTEYNLPKLLVRNPDPAVPDAFGSAALPDADTDGYDFNRDGIVDSSEQFPNLREYQNQTDPNKADTDKDGLPDGWESRFRYYGRVTLGKSDALCPDPVKMDHTMDCDVDGLLNEDEFKAGTNPWLADTDGDGLSDQREVTFDGQAAYNPMDLKTNPSGTDTNATTSDTDGDGLPDGWEVKYGFNPLQRNDVSGDPDHDGLINLYEAKYATNPLVNDTDQDRIPDGWEVINGLNPILDDSALDPDDDNLTNIDEYRAGSDPHKTDTDGDTLSDGVEAHGWDIKVNGVDVRVTSNPAKNDTDHDGLLDRWEFNITRTDPSRADTDQDGLSDGQEMQIGTSALFSDTDDDRLNDGDEYKFWTDIYAAEKARIDQGNLSEIEFLRVHYPWIAQWMALKDPPSPDMVLRAVFLPQGLGPDYKPNATTNQTAGEPTPSASPTLSPTPSPPAQNEPPEPDFDVSNESYLFLPDPAASLANHSFAQGDLDGDRLPNLVDRDADGDSLPDGVELLEIVDNHTQRIDDELLWFNKTGLAFVAKAPSLWENNVTGERWVAFTGLIPANATGPYFAPPDPVNRTGVFWYGDHALNATGGFWFNRTAGLWFNFTYVTNPADPDTDRDGMPDGWEMRFGLNPAWMDDAKYDPENDTFLPFGVTNGTLEAKELIFSNLKEFQAHTNPLDPETDKDKLGDGWEWYYGVRGLAAGEKSKLDPAKNDTDDNGTTDDKEDFDLDGACIYDRRHPGLRDAEHCSFNYDESHYVIQWIEFQNLAEYENKTNPFSADTDGDSMGDGWEAHYRRQMPDCSSGKIRWTMNPLGYDPKLDPDCDDLTNLDEYLWIQDPTDHDTNGDGLEDGFQVQLLKHDDPNPPREPADGGDR